MFSYNLFCNPAETSMYSTSGNLGKVDVFFQPHDNLTLLPAVGEGVDSSQD